MDSNSSRPVTKTIDPYRTYKHPIYSPVATTTGPSRIITTAGQIGADEKGNVTPDYEGQVAQAFKNIQRCLEAVGATVKDVLKLTYYIVNYDPQRRLHVGPLRAFLGDHRPATTLIPVLALAQPEYLFEVEATAAIPQAPTRNVDVVVVGGGLSGLQAAYDVQQAGLSCVVLEARDRVGGKTWSREMAGAKQDFGAAWINDTNQSRMFALVKKFGLKTIEQNTTGSVVMEDIDGSLHTFTYGTNPQKEAEKGGIENMVYVRDLFEKLCQKVDISNPAESGKALGKDYDSMTMEEFVKAEGGGKMALGVVAVSTRAMLGLEPSELSALYFLDYCKSGGGLMQMRSDRKHGGQYLRLAEGTQSFSIGLAGLLSSGSVVFKSPVRLIQQTDNGVYVSSARGDYIGKRVIVSVPTPLYKEIEFSPPLPDAKLELSQSTKLGTYAKMIVAYKEPWWRAKGLCGLLQSLIGTFAVTRDTSDDDLNHYALTCFIVGEPSRVWSKRSPQEQRDMVLGQLRRAFGPFVEVPEPIEILQQEWIKEQWSQGCPCPSMPPGVMTKLGHALRTAHGKVHFVGTETAFEWKGYMEGAVRSGERGAAEVVQALNKSRL